MDLRSCPAPGPTGEDHYKWLLNYQDHGAKFYTNAALVRKEAKAVAWALVEIFTLIGAPSILQTDNGKEFGSVAFPSGVKADMIGALL